MQPGARPVRNTELSESRGGNGSICPNVGRDGRDGLPGVPGATGRDGKGGERGEKGDLGLRGPPGPPGPRSGGAVYTRWGRMDCPAVSGTRLVYTGIVGGTYHSTKGGASNYLCMPKNPDYLEYTPGVQGWSPVHGAEYEAHAPYSNSNFRHLDDDNVPCAVCQVTSRNTMLMIPAKTQCPEFWTREYYGYLMTEWIGNYRTMFECVDRYAQALPGLAADTEGVRFLFTEGTCNGLPCPPYDPQKELTCVVCTN